MCLNLSRTRMTCVACHQAARAAVEHAVERGDTAAQLRRLVELERRRVGEVGS
jgi:hypothetical protein